MSIAEVVRANGHLYLSWLTEACSIPSLASDPDGLERMAGWLEQRFSELGGSLERLSEDGAPDALLVTLGSGAPSVMIYDHYDVQPVDPIELWNSGPFAPEVRDDVFYARGAADNKGDLVARMAAVHALQQVHESLPCTIKFLIEGEEETGSKSFEAIVNANAEKLGADGCVWEGHGIDHAGRGGFVFGAKGIAYVELTHRGLTEDQHSSLAVVAPSPVWHLIEALATLRAPDGRVLIDDFYDGVLPPSEDDLALLGRFPYDEAAEKKRLGVDSFIAGASGPEFLRRYFFEPTCNIAGIVAGFTQPGTSKTVLPKEARCKIDMRLVPGQDPHDIVDKLRSHLDARGFSDIELQTFSMEHPARSSPESAIGAASLRAAEGIFDEIATAPLMIGTGPMSHIVQGLGIPTVSPAGVCRPDSNIHAPNENVRVDDFLNIVEFSAAWMKEFGSGSAS